jgi:hypothetical protein
LRGAQSALRQSPVIGDEDEGGCFAALAMTVKGNA